MITNTNNIGATPNPNNAPLRPRPARTPASSVAREDSFSTVNSTNLEAALASTSNIRPEVVARARALTTDPSYPPLQIIEKLSRMIINSNDPSKEE